MYGKLEKIQGNQILITLDEKIDMYKVQRLSDGKKPTVEVDISDERRITPDQRKKIYALINDLCEYTGDVPEYWKEKFKFMVETIFEIDDFSLSNCSMTVGNYMILVILEFLFQHDIPFKTKVWDSIPDDFPKQALALKQKRCVICGRKADIDHFDTVGMGRNREKIVHVGMHIMTLCRVHHNERHKIGVLDFIQKYHLKPIKVTPEIAKKYRLGVIKDDSKQIARNKRTK
ncbi:putative HNHc nuclease [Ligilactobacillus cholophilus]|uniref:putative HNHc nuclease n=1 Tax=Ligilactobacillus cholophilus TaxID=3050131 RepID=UPI0025B03A7F|nr:putative HNHc nuclease [Ligilactobacillus cholophilus]